MLDIRLSPQSITYSIVGISFLPKLFSPLATSPTMIVALIFWAVPFVLFPELIAGYTSNKRRLSELPKLTLFILTFCLLCIIISFYFRGILYTEERTNLINIKRSLYLIHPIILFSWYPLVHSKQRKVFVKKFFILSLAFTITLAAPPILNSNFLGQSINNLTAIVSAQLSYFFTENEIHIHEYSFYSKNFAISVGIGCSALPQILIALFSTTIFYLCCKIQSKKYILILLVLTIPIIFISNSIRITILAYLVSINKPDIFEFWHNGLGGLLYSFLVMLFTSWMYYFLWSKENPLK